MTDYAGPPRRTVSGEIYDEVTQSQQVFKAYALAVNDGSVVPGINAALTAAAKAKM
jgi:hypothetical protein